MNIIDTTDDSYHRTGFTDEADLESEVVKLQKELFGNNRIYFNIKKRIGIAGKVRNIPDGYLLDLTSSKPRLFVVEIELDRHDTFRHIANQILQFSISFEDSTTKIIDILVAAIRDSQDIEMRCTQYSDSHGFHNIDHLIGNLVRESPFEVLIIIDEASDVLQEVLKKFSFHVDVLELAAFENAKGKRIYQYSPFLEGLTPAKQVSASESPRESIDINTVDTVVVPARNQGFNDVFLGEDVWYAVRISSILRSQLKYVAAYRTAPISGITHYAPIRSIEAYGESGKFKIVFEQSAQEISIIKLVKNGQVKALQNLRYTTKERLDNAKTLDELFA